MYLIAFYINTIITMNRNSKIGIAPAQIGIVVAPGESELLAKQLQHLSRQPEEVAAMGERAKRVYDKHFGFERSLQHYNELLLSL